ncbi:MAG: HAD-IIIC family phosphatase [Phycisphaeraceae bacterium]
MVLQTNEQMTTLASDAMTSPQASALKPLAIAVAATFTAEPIEASLQFWMKQLGFNASIELGPYNQIFQLLLDPSSLLGRSNDANLLLIRVEDWQREAIEHGKADAIAGDLPLDLDKANRDVDDFINAARAASARSTTPLIVLLCPPTPALHAAMGAELDALESRLIAGLADTSIHLLTPRDLALLYPVENYHDAQLDRMGHIPFTDEAFAAIGTLAARRIAAIKRSPKKVIALDCDNTLWRGVVGEDGPEGVKFDPGFMALQHFMIAQAQAGMVLCLVSKNIEDDVAKVFEVRDDMPLKNEHIVARKVNWVHKSQNLSELASELSLGIDSFIFIDDNPVECAQVQAALPQVLVLNLPKEDAAIPGFLKHVWEFDHLKVTGEDRKRTEMYRQNVAREQAMKQSITFDDFLTSLNLQIILREPDAQAMPRVAQLTQRTNQFNFTTLRRTQPEIETALNSGKLHCLIVEVKDRFGDYGLVGLMLYELTANELKIDSFMLSCRVLGRGVEHRMLQRLGEIAKERRLAFVHAPLIPTKKNIPALNFLRSVDNDYEALLSEGYTFRFPTDYAAGLSYTPPATAPTDLPREGGSTSSESSEGRSDSAQRIATELCTASDILAAVEAGRVRDRGNLDAGYVPATDDVQRQLVSIWEDVLDVQPIGVQDDFFNLGGDSLGAVRILAEVERAFGRKLPQQVLFERPTIEALQQAIADGASEMRMPTLVKINERGTKPPFFAIAPADGIGLIYKELSRCLGDDQPFYALNRKDLDFSELRTMSIEGLAEYYIRIMRQVQPAGPYHLGGYCNGTYVAAEITRQLLAAGEQIGTLAIFDFWYCKEMPKEAAVDHSLRGRWRALRQRDGRFLPLMLLSLMKRKLFGSAKAAAPAAPKAVAVQDDGDDMTPPPAATGSDPAREKAQQQSYQLQRLIQYRVPQCFAAHVHYFGCDTGRWKTEYTDGWEKIALQGVTLHIVPGEHHTILIRPNVQVLAEKLRAVLAEAHATS